MQQLNWRLDVQQAALYAYTAAGSFYRISLANAGASASAGNNNNKQKAAVQYIDCTEKTSLGDGYIPLAHESLWFKRFPLLPRQQRHTNVCVRWKASGHPHYQNASLQILDAESLALLGNVQLPVALRSAAPDCLELQDGLMFMERGGSHRPSWQVVTTQDGTASSSPPPVIRHAWVLHQNPGTHELVLERGRPMLQKHMQLPWKWASTGAHVYAMQPSDLGEIFYFRSAHDVVREPSSSSSLKEAAAATRHRCGWDVTAAAETGESKRERQQPDHEHGDAEEHDTALGDASASSNFNSDGSDAGTITAAATVIQPLTWNASLALDPAVEYAIRSEANDCRGTRALKMQPLGREHLFALSPNRLPLPCSATSYATAAEQASQNCAVLYGHIGQHVNSLTHWSITRTEGGVRSRAGWSCNIDYNGFAMEEPMHSHDDPRLLSITQSLAEMGFPRPLLTIVAEYVFLL